MKLTPEEVREVAHLSRLEMTDSEVERYTAQLGKILEYASMLDELDIRDIEPTSHVIPISNVMREDIVAPSYPVDEMLANAPETRGNSFSVPKIIDDSDSH